jgi:glycosyltransferase involved in cell wall biosynthesis
VNQGISEGVSGGTSEGMSGAVPLCSVIVPVYAHAAYVEAALDSVAAQTHPAIELIVIDDASPDASYQRAQHWFARHQLLQAPSPASGLAQPQGQGPMPAGRFVRASLLRNASNAGAHATINQGLALARGDYVTVLNSDDAYAPQRLERLLAAMQARPGGPARLAFSSVQPFSADATPAHPGFWQLLNFIGQVAPRLPALSFACLAHNCAISSGNLLMERSLAQQIGPMADLPLAHDWDYLLRACLLTEPLLLPEPLYHYRLHRSNTFAGLAERSSLEREACVGRFLQAVRSAPPPNCWAPNPFDWPGLFEHFVARWGWAPLWQRLGAGAP